MSYLDLFQRYGRPSSEAEIRLTAYLLRPDTLTADRIKANTISRVVIPWSLHSLITISVPTFNLKPSKPLTINR